MKVARGKSLYLHVLIAVVTSSILITAILTISTYQKLIFTAILILFILAECAVHYQFKDLSRAIVAEYFLVSVMVFITLANAHR